jgi:hypothetical protein
MAHDIFFYQFFLFRLFQIFVKIIMSRIKVDYQTLFSTTYCYFYVKHSIKRGILIIKNEFQTNLSTIILNMSIHV